MSDFDSLVFASGEKNGGGSGFENLVTRTRTDNLHTNIVGVASNHEFGGVRERADRLGVEFYHLPEPWTAEAYQDIAERSGAKYFLLSGWRKYVVGLPSNRMLNIHNGPPEFSGRGMFGINVHRAVIEKYHAGLITHTAIFMHCVTKEYDRGPSIFRCNIPIRPDDTPETLEKRVNCWEHHIQPMVTDLFVTEQITWSGNPDDPVVFPDWYKQVTCVR
jgi:phosphoribosylglycinamide formyltransferase-1